MIVKTSIMNYIQKYILLIFLFLGYSANAQLTMTINIVYPAPTYLSDWSYNRSGVATLILNRATDQNMMVKFSTQLLNSNGTVVATSNNSTASTYPIHSGANVFTLDKVLQPDNLRFLDGNVIKSIQTTGKLPPENYQLCVQVLGTINGTIQETELLKAPVCRFFSQISYQLPYLLSPIDKTWLDANIAQSLITFRWSSIVPRPKENVTYRLQVFEVSEHQLPMQAFRSNQPILSVDLVNTQYIWRPQLDFKDKSGSIFIWTVQTLDIHGNPLTTNDGTNLGWSQPQVFGVCNNLFKGNFSDECGNGRKFEE